MSYFKTRLDTIPITEFDKLNLDNNKKPTGVIAPVIINENNQLSGFVHSIETGAAVDGPGVRFVLFTSGCQFRCLYCHNPDTWKLRNGLLKTVDEIIAEIGKYARFLKFAGGVTFSGGEPLMQANFIGEIAYRIKREFELHVALDTQGFLAGHLTNEWFNNIDLVMLDIKHIDPKKYQILTSQSLQPTLDFAHRLIKMKKKMWIRYVIVPDLSDDLVDAENHAKFIRLLQDESQKLYGIDLIERIEILPFHNLGELKWRELNLSYQLKGLAPPSTDTMEKIRNFYKERNLNVV